jgi:hypothetical protein
VAKLGAVAYARLLLPEQVSLGGVLQESGQDEALDTVRLKGLEISRAQ